MSNKYKCLKKKKKEANFTKQPFHGQTDFNSTYIHDEEVQPAPGVCKVLDKAIGNPFQQHLQDEDVGENPIRIFQNDAHGFPLFNVHVFKGLKGSRDELLSYQ